MQTNDLIRSLVADLHAPAPSVSAHLAASVVAGTAVATAGFFAVLGPRPDIAEAVATVRFDLKIALTLLLLSAAAILVVRLSRPAAGLEVAAAALLAAVLLYPVAAAFELALVPRAEWLAAMIGNNAYVCLPAIVTMSLPVLAAAIYALRQGAPTRPGVTGAVAGLLAGAIAASLYAIHCTDDSPLFVAVWYGLAYAVTAMLGGIAGRVWLRW
jgi:hypothetical protein